MCLMHASIENPLINSRLVAPHLDAIIRLSNSQDTTIRSSAASVLLNLIQNGNEREGERGRGTAKKRNSVNLVMFIDYLLFTDFTRDSIIEKDGQNALISLVLVEEPTLQVTAAKALARLAEDGIFLFAYIASLYILICICFLIFNFNRKVPKKSSTVGCPHAITNAVGLFVS